MENQKIFQVFVASHCKYQVCYICHFKKFIHGLHCKAKQMGHTFENVSCTLLIYTCWKQKSLNFQDFCGGASYLVVQENKAVSEIFSFSDYKWVLQCYVSFSSLSAILPKLLYWGMFYRCQCGKSCGQMLGKQEVMRYLVSLPLNISNYQAIVFLLFSFPPVSFEFC